MHDPINVQKISSRATSTRHHHLVDGALLADGAVGHALLGRDGEPGHDRREPRVEHRLAAAAEHLRADLKRDRRQQVRTVRTDLHTTYRHTGKKTA